MSKIQFPRMTVLQSLHELTADITPNRFISTRPNAVGEQMKEFLLIRLPQSIEPWGDACQFSYGQIVIFAKDIQGGLENTLALEKLQSAVMELFGDTESLITDLYTAFEPRLFPGGTDNVGFHSLIIQFRLQIK